MNFFEQQDRARRNSTRLVILLALAVLSLIALTSLSLVLIWEFFAGGELFSAADYARLIGSVAVVVVSVVLLGSLYKTVQLSSGGKVVAERLGGRLINLQPRDFAERRLLNVVEEMALASGTPVPPVYVLDDASINAFAAGLTPQDAVIGITRGALETLNREELQGVIAHEFSHVFHGDMRLNTRLVAVLHGILLIGLIGQLLLRGASHSSARRSSNRDSGNAAVAIVVTGLALVIIGYAGTFFGNLIKAAVSRQREFLADASAVQFTRNPDGIAGALKKIGGHVQGSQLSASNAAEFSHMYFSEGVHLALSGLMATHPPLPERIRRIEPRWDGQFPVVVRGAEVFGEEGPRHADEALVAGLTASVTGLAAADAAIAAIGSPGETHLQQARSTLQQLPDELREAAHRLLEAPALVLALLLDADADQRARQWQLLRPQLDPVRQAALEKHEAALLALPASLRLPLLELLIPTLKQLDVGQQLALRRQLTILILADRQVSLVEWSLLRIVERNLAPPRPIDGHYQLVARAEDCQVLLSALAHAGHADPAEAEAAFEAAWNRLPPAIPAAQLLPAEQADLRALDQSLKHLHRLMPLQKPALLKALAACCAHDGRIEPAEAELMRAIADCIDCPMPPLLPA